MPGLLLSRVKRRVAPGRQRIRALSVGLLLVVAACLPEPLPPEDDDSQVVVSDREAIAAITSDYRYAYNWDEYDELTVLFAEDGMLLLSNEPPLAGHAAIAQRFARLFSESISAISIDEQSMEVSMVQAAGEVIMETVEIEIAGDWAFSRGTFALWAMTSSGEDAVFDTGNWLNILRRQDDGSWLIHRSHWTRDNDLEHPDAN